MASSSSNNTRVARQQQKNIRKGNNGTTLEGMAGSQTIAHHWSSHPIRPREVLGKGA